MKKLLFISVSVFFFSTAQAQPDELPQNSIQLFSGVSEHGTDMVSGFGIAAQYSHYFRNKISWTTGFTTTFHDGTYPISFFTNGNWVESMAQFTTGGVQVGFQLGYDFLHTSKHIAQAKLGSFIRYQTSTNFVTSNPYYLTPSSYFERLGSKRTMEVGGLLSISYNYNFRNNYFLIIDGSIQVDFNYNSLNLIGIGIGKRFGKL